MRTPIYVASISRRTHDGNNINEESWDIDVGGIIAPQPKNNGKNTNVNSVDYLTYQAAHRMTIRIATAVARLAMTRTKYNISR